MKAWLKKWWWTLLLGAVAVGVGLWLIFRKKKTTQPPAQSFSRNAREKIVEAETEARIERIKVEAKSEAKREELKKIEKIDDGFERRKKLADYLDENL